MIPAWAFVSAGLTPVVLIAAWVIAGELQPSSYSPMRQTVSVLSGHAGADSWVMTGGLVLVGIGYLVTAAGMSMIGRTARLGLVAAGVAAIGVALCPVPSHGSTPSHMFWTGVGELAIASWPVLMILSAAAARPPALRVTVVASAVSCALLIWLVYELHEGSHLGFAERLTSSAQVTWPFVVALGLRRRRVVGSGDPSAVDPVRPSPLPSCSRPG
ncbi:MAG: hypothetical protein QOF92_293 [Pseudonocardiales bacterium]|nr:hypothetical protein [Pseudonocardiales bacterium]